MYHNSPVIPLKNTNIVLNASNLQINALYIVTFLVYCPSYFKPSDLKLERIFLTRRLKLEEEMLSYKYCANCGKLFNGEETINPLDLLMPDVLALSQAERAGTPKVTLPMSGLEVEIVFHDSLVKGVSND